MLVRTVCIQCHIIWLMTKKSSETTALCKLNNTLVLDGEHSSGQYHFQSKTMNHLHGQIKRQNFCYRKWMVWNKSKIIMRKNSNSYHLSFFFFILTPLRNIFIPEISSGSLGMLWEWCNLCLWWGSVSEDKLFLLIGVEMTPWCFLAAQSPLSTWDLLRFIVLEITHPFYSRSSFHK